MVNSGDVAIYVVFVNSMKSNRGLTELYLPKFSSHHPDKLKLP